MNKLTKNFKKTAIYLIALFSFSVSGVLVAGDTENKPTTDNNTQANSESYDTYYEAFSCEPYPQCGDDNYFLNLMLGSTNTTNETTETENDETDSE